MNTYNPHTHKTRRQYVYRLRECTVTLTAGVCIVVHTLVLIAPISKKYIHAYSTCTSILREIDDIFAMRPNLLLSSPICAEFLNSPARLFKDWIAASAEIEGFFTFTESPDVLRLRRIPERDL